MDFAKGSRFGRSNADVRAAKWLIGRAAQWAPRPLESLDHRSMAGVFDGTLKWYPEQAGYTSANAICSWPSAGNSPGRL
jgi:hypothetical protein